MEELKEFKNEYGHLNIPQKYSSLGGFVKYQRYLRELLLKGEPAVGMTTNRVKELDALGFKW